MRPASYEDMNNFYTMTVYEKGAEVVRMYHTFLGEEGFQKGMKLYFERHDGQAVTCDDFRAAMADANGFDFEQFALWYSQAGTPVLDITGRLNDQGDYVLNIRQSIPPTPDMADKQPMSMPLAVALFSPEEDSFGEKIPFRLTPDGAPQTEAVLHITAAEQQITLYGANRPAVPSLLRGFSAPVILNYPYTDQELGILLSADDDPFAKWEAAQTLYRRAVRANQTALSDGLPAPEHNALMQALEYVLNADFNPAFQALLLQLPPEADLWAEDDNIDPLLVHRAREALLDAVATRFLPQFRSLNNEAAAQEQAAPSATRYEYSPDLAGWRALRNTCRAYILRADPAHIAAVAEKYGEMAQNMTHEWGILSAVNHIDRPERDRLLAQFAEKFADDPLVMDKYFALIASCRRADTPQQIQAALQHPAFNLQNPNKARALLGTFSRNVPHFHAADGWGYRFLADKILEADRFNPSLAARLAHAFNICRRLEPVRRNLMAEQLRRINGTEGLSGETGEIVGKILQAV